MNIFILNGKTFNWRFFNLLYSYLFIVLTLDLIECENVSEDFQEFRYCLKKSTQPNLKECIGRSAISFLQRFDESENITLATDIVVTKDERMAGRSFVNFLDSDPVDIRGILENAGAVISQRSFEWHMDRLYPGLMLKVGPSADTNSVAEFVLDPTIDERNFNSEDVPTARILTKQYILPLLLGLKFNLVALVPLLFAVICLLLKKSLFIAKLVIYISSLLGIGGVASAFGSLGGWSSLFASPIKPHLHHPGGGHFPGSFGLYPGKNTVFPQYDEDELQNSSPYKRQDRKVAFDKPRENAGKNENNKNLNAENVRGTVVTDVTSKPAVDHFYDYERQVLMQDRSGRLRQGKLGPSAYGDEIDGDVGVINTSSSHRFMTTGANSGWKIVRV